MKDKFLKILTVSAILATIGLLMDGDLKEPSMMMRFVEFFAMVGIVFVIISTFYLATRQVYKYLQKA